MVGRGENSPIPLPEEVLELLCAHFEVDEQQILGRSRRQYFCYPRNMAYFLFHIHLSLSYEAIGLIFGRDHTTVMSGVHRIQKALDDGDAEVQLDMLRLSMSDIWSLGSTIKFFKACESDNHPI